MLTILFINLIFMCLTANIFAVVTPLAAAEFGVSDAAIGLMGAEEDGRPLWKVIRSHPEYLSVYHEVMNMLLCDHLLTGEFEAEIERVSEMLLPWIEKDPTAFCAADEFQTACETMKTFLAIRTESILRQLDGEISTVSEEQEEQDMMDASGLDLQSLGALVVGK